MTKNNVTYSRVSNAHLKKLMKGEKAITIKPSDHNNEENVMVELDFKTKKHMNRLHKNLHSGKGTRIVMDHLNDLKVHNGNGFFDSIRHAFSPQNIVNTLKTVAPDVAGGLAGAGATALFPESGPLAGMAAGMATKYAVKKAINGNGIIGDTFRKITRI